MKRLLLALTALSVVASPAAAFHDQLAGLWTCTVNARSNDPSANYGLEVEVQVNPDGTLYGRGTVIYHALANNLQGIEGWGDWTVMPDEGQGELVKFRMMPGNHPIVTWFARPTGPGTMYNLFNPPRQNGRTATVETQCGKFG